MVLRLKARESRSPPGLARIRKKQPHSLLSPPASAFLSSDTAGWSSPVARQAHNLKVRGSNPLPATKSLLNTNHLHNRPAHQPGDPFCMSAQCPKNTRPRVSSLIHSFSQIDRHWIAP